MEKKKASIKPASIKPAAANEALVQQVQQQTAGAPHIKQHCESHLHRYVLAQTHDGWCVDGFVEHVDDEYVCLAVLCDGAHGHGGYGDRAFIPYGPFFGGGLYPYPYYPRRRFYRQVFPLAALLGLSLLPFY